MSKREYEYLIDIPILEGLAHALGKDYCEGHDGIVNETSTFINPNSGDQVDRCDDCRPGGGWVRQRETKD